MKTRLAKVSSLVLADATLLALFSWIGWWALLVGAGVALAAGTGAYLRE